MAARKTFESIGFFSAALLCASAHPALADVLEIAPNGDVTVYDRPAVFSTAGAAPIALAIATPEARELIVPMLEQSAERAGVSAELVEAVAWAESRFDTAAVSSRGAIGVMQLMPETAQELGVDPLNPAQNIDGGARYLRKMIDAFGGDVNLALAAYNAGAAAVRAHGGIPPFKETEAYVAAVLGYMASKAALQ